MKKLVFSIAIASSALLVQAQDYSKVQLYVIQKKWADANKELTKLLADAKAQNNPETYAWKATLNSEIGADASLATQYPDANKNAYEAINELRKKDPTNKVLKDNALRAVSLVYSANFLTGRTLFQESKWSEALEKFKVAEDLGDLISKNGFGTTKQNIDTFTVLYAGYAAQNAKKTDDCLYYYEKFANEKVPGKDFEDLYRYVVDYYSKNGDKEKFNKYLSIASTLYPASKEVWDEYALDAKTKGASITELMGFYKAEDAAGTLTAASYESYGAMFANPDKEKLAKLDSTAQIEVKKVAIDAFKKAFDKSSNAVYAFNAGILNYQIFSVLDDRFYTLKGTAPALKLQRDNIEKEMQVIANQSIELLEKSYTLLKAKETRTKVEISCLSKSIDNLTNIYDWKRNRARGKDLKAFDAAEAKFKFYDAEHGSYDIASIKIGMKKELVLQKLGKPDRTSETTTASGTTAILFYDNYSKVIGIDENGIVTYINQITK